MGLDKVKEEILENARKQASSLVESARKEADGFMRAAEGEAKKKEDELKQEIPNIAASMKRKEQAAAELELKKKKLALKSELIELVFSKAKDRLGRIRGKRREDHLRKLFEDASRELEAAVVYCSESDLDMVKGMAGGAEVVKDVSISGGLIVESSDRRFRADYSYESLLEQTRVRVLGDVAEKLFGK